MSQVKFTEMKNGSKEDYLLLDKHEKKFAQRKMQLNYLKKEMKHTKLI